ncbi:MAG: threonylcarbamoyl-AMP synthase [Candidatus Pacebacteria bacterium]|nr:threonylcarbamoyl-AMP synthase [Candidatus Paceibacterota bacterium]
MTKIIHISEIYEHVNEIIKTFKNGGVVLYPTDTQYALGVLARSETAIEKISSIKEVSSQKAVSIVVSDIEMAAKYVYFNDYTRGLMDKYLPGPLTLILPAKDIYLAKNIGNEDKIGIRIPDKSGILNIVKELDCPITTTSANISGQEPGDSCRQVLKDLQGIDLAIDGGELENEASTVIECSDSGFEVIRQGVLVV